MRPSLRILFVVSLVCHSGLGCGSGSGWDCPPGPLLITDTGWNSDGAFARNLPRHAANDSYLIGRVNRDGPTGAHDYLVAAVLKTSSSPVKGAWILKLIAKDGAYQSGILEANASLCLAQLDWGVRWLDLGRDKDFVAGPFLIM